MNVRNTSEHPLLIASIPTDPVPLYKSNQRPPGLNDAGQPPATWEKHLSNYHKMSNQSLKCYEWIIPPNYDKLAIISCGTKFSDIIKRLKVNNIITCRIPKAAPFTTSIIGRTSMPFGESNFLLRAVPPKTWTSDEFEFEQQNWWSWYKQALINQMLKICENNYI